MAGESPARAGGFPGWLGPGSLVAGYVLRELIGAGGMAAVYRAYDARLDKDVALKLLAPALAGDERFRRRFVREARAAARVDHPHIIPVFSAGDENGVPYLAMRLVRGSDLRAIINREGGMAPWRAAAFVSPVASALDAAHDAGLVHRDVKPANMLVDIARGRPEHVYLTDFGLARGLSSVGRLTTPGQFMGTPDYAAPEQITGAVVDGRADQYALAGVVYTLLTGGVPYHRDEPLAVMYAQLHHPPPRVTAARPDLPAAVDRVLARALEKEPGKRYGDCGAFADALREALGLSPYVPAPLWRTSPARAGRGSPGSSPLPAQLPPTQAAPETQAAPAAPTVALPPAQAPTRAARSAAPRQPPAPPGTGVPRRAWAAAVTADRAYYDSVQAADVSEEARISFPGHHPEQRFPLSGPEVRIGRRSVSRGIAPEIDLTGPPADLGVSHQHAKLLAGQDGLWYVMDLGTENGTLVNGVQIPPGEAVRLRHGDRINLGVWTAITLTRD